MDYRQLAKNLIAALAQYDRENNDYLSYYLVQGDRGVGPLALLLEQLLPDNSAPVQGPSSKAGVP